MATEMTEFCQCHHMRAQHADHVNPLQVVPVAMTEADAADQPRGPSPLVRGAGPCTVEGCDCPGFRGASEA